MCRSQRYTSGSFAFGLLVPPLRAVKICLSWSGFSSGVSVGEADASPCCPCAAIVFRLVLPGLIVSSDPTGDVGSGVVGLGAPDSLSACSSASPGMETSRFSASVSMSFSLYVAVLSVC